MATHPKIKWTDDCEEQDFPAAESYLSLSMRPKKVKTTLSALRKSRIVTFRAKDIFRASGLSLLGVSNSHVESDRTKIRKRIPMSPLLLVRDEALGRVVIADGYHRLCAVYSFDEDALVPCRIA